MLLVRIDVLPLYAQVSMDDPLSVQVPQWSTGEELVVANATCITVATRPDHLGDVHIEVWHEHIAVDSATLGTPIYVGTLDLTGRFAQVGSYVANDMALVDLGAGPHRVSVFTTPSGQLAEHVYFLVG